MVRRTSTALLALALGACTPSFSDQTSIVQGPRLLAVQAVAPEAALGGSFALTALYVGPAGQEDPSALNWDTCLQQKPVGEPGPIAPVCFVDSSGDLLPFGTGGSVHGTIPESACQLFGPDSPPPQPGQPSARPTDPDSTGGFYLPIRVKSGDGDWSVAPERIACPPSGVTEDVFTAFMSGYHLNENPVAASLSLADQDGGATAVAPDAPGKGPGLSVSRGQRVNLTVAWPTCPTAPAACDGAEAYIAVDPTTKQLVGRRESMVTSWYATGGTLDLDRVGRDEGDLATTAENAWTAPASPTTVHLWVVLRDARGGIGWESYTIDVGP
jgi:hypothetical protein